MVFFEFVLRLFFGVVYVRRGVRRLYKYLFVCLMCLVCFELSVLIKFFLVVELSVMFVLLGMISKYFILLEFVRDYSVVSRTYFSRRRRDSR